jgi:hypothetical protein
MLVGRAGSRVRLFEPTSRLSKSTGSLSNSTVSLSMSTESLSKLTQSLLMSTGGLSEATGKESGSTEAQAKRLCHLKASTEMTKRMLESPSPRAGCLAQTTSA